MRSMSLMLLATGLAAAVAFPCGAREARLVHAPDMPATAPVPLADPCIACGRLYGLDPSGFLYEVDVATGTSSLVSFVPFPQFFDIGISAAGDLYGVTSEGDFHRIDACSGSTVMVDFGFGNGMGGDPLSTVLYVQGPPLGIYDTVLDTTSFIGGNIGSDPPDWCGPSSGDLAHDSETNLLVSTISCPECAGGDMLVTIDPNTGAVVEEVGCVVDGATGAGVGGVFGLAFDDECRLYGSPGFGPVVHLIDKDTAQATQIPIVGGYDGAFGLASLRCPDAAPCGVVAPPRCEPLTQGFWKRQCRGAHPSGEDARLDGYSSCVGATRTFAGTRTRDGVCSELFFEPSNEKCEQAEGQFMALLLNTCSGRLGLDCCIETEETSATTVGEAIEEIDALLSNPMRSFRDCVRAQAIADAINTGAAACDGPVAASAPGSGGQLPRFTTPRAVGLNGGTPPGLRPR